MRFIGVVVIGVCVVGVGCGSGKEEETSEIGHVDSRRVATQEQFLSLYGAWVCGLLFECGTGTSPFGEGAECERQFRISVESAITSQPNLTYDAERAAACLNAVSGTECLALASLDLGASCGQVFRGDVTHGGTCVLTQECQAGLYCELGVGCGGTCEPLPGQGEACPGFICAEGMSCVFADDRFEDGQCETRGAEGVMCGAGVRDCQAGLVCSAMGSAAGTCLPVAEAYPPRGLGESCSTSLQCEPGQFCSGQTGGVCAEQLRAGAECTGDSAACGRGLECVFLDGRTSCEPGLPAGAACNPDSLDGCLEGECVEGTCGFRRALGESCSEDWTCYSSNCDEGVCAAPDPCPETVTSPRFQDFPPLSAFGSP
jgi:hypothetical protein